MNLFFYVVILSFLVSALLVIIARLIAIRAHSDREKLRPFECGFDSKKTSRSAFSLRFFLLTIVFLVFDIEITFLLPIPFIVTSRTMASIIFLSCPVCIILLLGLLHE